MKEIPCVEHELTKEEIVALIGKNEKPLIFDIGTYDGADSASLKAALNNDAAMFFCFEADPRSQALFEAEKYNENLMLEKMAVGKTVGKVTLYQSDSDTRRHASHQNSWCASSSINPPKTHLKLFRDVYFKKTIEVECTTLDYYFNNTEYLKHVFGWRGSNIIDFIWVDINGAEEDFIIGATQALKQTRYLYMEFSDKELYEKQITKDEILALLPNFVLMGIYNFKGNFGNLLLKNTLRN